MSIILWALLALILGWTVYCLIRHFRRGDCGCGRCSGCPSRNNCRRK